ncbi:Thymidylate kinase [Streptosporangium canum]|uniref:Thymidylate kinase n=1 Tax=Streptosporangium canum TaxID=324952 RepID=A0A1I4FTX7_9ACTN|nr:hypothetical protein [Streptosporangium canum]SFL20869.1 Thymidylate kinase [Streptosporangium canum]
MTTSNVGALSCPTATLAFDGPPGAGKTSLLAALVPVLGDRCVFFSEPNIKLANGPQAPIHPGTAAHTLWYLRSERLRMAALPSCAAAYNAELVLLDRNHLGVLAYCFATRHPDAIPYSKALGYYSQHIAPALPDDMRTVILQIEVEDSLRRRGRHPTHPRWQQWYDPDLLERMSVFYREHAPELCPRPPLIIDTGPLDRDAVMTIVATELAAAGITLPAHVATADPQPPIDGAFAIPYNATGGAAVLGNPVTSAFPYRDGQMQMFQLGSLYRVGDHTHPWNPLKSNLFTEAIS